MTKSKISSLNTDRELLELAAKAEGRKWLSYDSGYGKGLCCKDDKYGGLIEYYWNPLTENGDALRLAVKLSLTIYQWPDEVCVCNEKGTINEDIARVGDIYAAARRVIVRAAAEIGKQM